MDNNKERVLPNYCRKCGKKLVRIKGKTSFDTQTGEEKFSIRLLCPAKDIDTFLKKNKISMDTALDSLTSKQRDSIEKFLENGDGHTNRRFKLINK